MKGAHRLSSHTSAQEREASPPHKMPSGSRSARSLRPKEEITAAAIDHLPATVSAAELLDQGSDSQFRVLIQNLLTIARRVEMARDYFGRLINVTGPQYHLLMTVAQLQGASGVSVGTVAQMMQVSSAFVTSETGKLAVVGLLKKRPNPLDGRGALLSLTESGLLKMNRLIPEICAVNDRFFGGLDGHSFRELCTSSAVLVHGSREAIRYSRRAEEASL